MRTIGGDTRHVVLDGDDGLTYALVLPPGWSIASEPGARVLVTGEMADAADASGGSGGSDASEGADASDAADVSRPADGPTLRVRRISPA
jgi:hypothetical protein